MYYLIKETLEETTLERCLEKSCPYVAVLDKKTFLKNQDKFGFVIDMEFAVEDDTVPLGYVTKAEVNFDSLTGCFNIPSKQPGVYSESHFYFALDENGIVFIDDDKVTDKYLDIIKNSKRWRIPSLERFIFDFLESITKKDLGLLEDYEKEMDAMEDNILKDFDEGVMERITDIRSELQDLRVHYEQMLDLAQELCENENNFFKTENLRYFRQYCDRLARLQDIVSSLREYSMQLRDLYHYQMDVRQNRLISILTVVSTIFMPLTLITGWYGMNFANMPELATDWGYPGVIALSILISIGEVVYFKKKKWL